VSGLLERAASILERRFLKNALLPVALFFPSVVIPFLLGRSALDAVLRFWQRQSTELKLLEVIGYFALVWFLAAVVQSQWRNIIRLFEGYPLQRFLPVVAAIAKRWHQGQLHRLVGDEQWAKRYYAYPPEEDDIMPTRLGNILRAAEYYPKHRYGADTILLWPRMSHVIPREHLNDIEEARASLEFILVVALWCYSFGIASLVLLTLFGSDPMLAALLFTAGVTGAYAAYASALRLADEYGDQLRSGFEVYRHDLLERLKIKIPDGPDEERKTWEELRYWLGQGRAKYARPYVLPGAPDLVVEIRRLP
jgi:hypothetical protein